MSHEELYAIVHLRREIAELNETVKLLVKVLEAQHEVQVQKKT